MVRSSFSSVKDRKGQSEWGRWGGALTGTSWVGGLPACSHGAGTGGKAETHPVLSENRLPALPATHQDQKSCRTAGGDEARLHLLSLGLQRL